MDNKDIIYETDYWKVIFYGNQRYLGTCCVDLKRDCGALSKLSKEEWEDLFENVVKKLENAITKAFGATMFNWDCLGNGAYLSDDPKPLIHFHVVPRYKNSVTFAGEEFVDSEFGYGSDMSNKRLVSEDVRGKIMEEIKKNL